MIRLVARSGRCTCGSLDYELRRYDLACAACGRPWPRQSGDWLWERAPKEPRPKRQRGLFEEER